jgi:hypothetical protein
MRLTLSTDDGDILDIWDADDLDADTLARLYALFGITIALPDTVAAALAAGD